MAITYNESKLQLYKVDFEIFQGAIKRFGYKVDLNDNHMLAIASDLKIDLHEMKNIPTSPFAVVYKDEKKFF